MKRALFTLISLQLFLICRPQAPNQTQIDSSSDTEIPEKELIGKSFPFYKISNKNKSWSNHSLLGKTVYINFWFAACAPCMAEMPQINDLYEHFKADTNFVMLSFSFDEQGVIDSIKTARKMEYEIFRASQEECRRLNRTHSYPANVVVDKDGITRFYETGGLMMGWLTTRHFKSKLYPEIEKSLGTR